MDVIRNGIKEFALQFKNAVVFIVTLLRFILSRDRPRERKPLPLPVYQKVENGIHRRLATADTESHFPIPINMFDLLTHGRDLSKNGPCLGVRPNKTGAYQWLTYQEVIDRAKNFGAGLLDIGAKPDGEYLIGFFAKTSLEWTVAEYGCFAYGMATAPLYDTLGAEACQETVKLYNIEVMVCDGNSQVTTLTTGGHFPPNLRTIITIDHLKPELVAQLENMGVKLVTFAQVEEMGRIHPRSLRLASEDSLASLIFTSGTTGPPKGAMLTHACFMRSLKTFIQTTHPFRMTTDLTALAVFPLAHVFERLIEKLVLLHGGKIGYLSDDLKGMLGDAQILHPSLFIFVPRIMNRVYDQIKGDMDGSIYGRTIGRLALAMKQRQMNQGIFSTNTIWDLLVFRKYQALLGGNVQLGWAAAAASDASVLRFTRTVFGCCFFEMYGQTESCGPITCTAYGDMSAGHVGIPFVDVEVKLVDVPEMGYFAAEQRGEICSRSRFIMRGYYDMPEKTAEAIDQDGWLHTGDIGTWTEDGKLKLFDRKKHIFKLSQGEYIAPERLEGIFGRSKYITNIFIDGDSRYPYPVALIYPNYEALGVSAKQITIYGKPSPHECYVRETIMEDLIRLGKEHKFKLYEVPKKITLIEESFSVENNCLTQSQKTKRETVRAIYRDRIRKLYGSN